MDTYAADDESIDINECISLLSLTKLSLLERYVPGLTN